MIRWERTALTPQLGQTESKSRSMAARVLQKFKPTLPEKFKGGKLEKIGRILFYFM